MSFFFLNRFLLLVPLRMRHLVRVTLEKHHHNYNGYSRFGLRAINKRTQGDRTGRLQEELSATGGLRRWLRRGRIYAESWWQEENPHQSRRKTYIQNLDFGQVTQEASPQSTLGGQSAVFFPRWAPPSTTLTPLCTLAGSDTVTRHSGPFAWQNVMILLSICVWPLYLKIHGFKKYPW